MLYSSLLSLSVIICTIPGLLASSTQVTPCQVSEFRVNLEGSLRLFEDSKGFARLWKSECDCLVRAKGYYGLARSPVSLVGLYAPYFNPPTILPDVGSPDCTWPSIEQFFKEGEAAAAKALKLLGTIECFLEKGFDTTPLQVQYDQSVALFVAVSDIISNVISACPIMDCDRLLAKQLQLQGYCSKPACNTVAVTNYMVDYLTDLTKRAQSAFQLASPAACNCCLEKVGFGLDVTRMLNLITIIYIYILDNTLVASKNAMLLPLNGTCDCANQTYSCGLSSDWAFRNLSFKNFFNAMDLMRLAAESIASCAAYQGRAIKQIVLKFGELYAFSGKLSVYAFNLNAACTA